MEQSRPTKLSIIGAGGVGLIAAASNDDDDYDHDRAQHDMDIINAMNYAEDDDDDDGGRSTTAGSAPFPSLAALPQLILTLNNRYSD